MSHSIIEEASFFLSSFLMGIMITFAYDWLVICRKVIRHHNIVISLEDLLFWIACAIAIFAMLYEENNGVPRWFAIAAAAVGMLLYKMTLGRLFVWIMAAVLSALFRMLKKAAHIAAKPFVCAGMETKNCVCRIGIFLRKKGRSCKKKLTACKKIVKIILCKR